MDVVAAERSLYTDVWTGVEAYGRHSPGAAYVPLFRAMTGAERGSVLDVGCGSGKGAIALAAAGFDVALADLTDAGLDEDARRFPFSEACLWSPTFGSDVSGPYDYTYCCDVLEHVPPEYTMLAIARVLETTRRRLFLSIALQPDQFGMWVGRPLHQTVQPFEWWRDRVRSLGRLIECRDLLASGLYVVQPR